MCATKLAGVIKHSFILRLEDFSEENLCKQASKILQSKWADEQEFRWGSQRAMLKRYAIGVKVLAEEIELDSYAKRVLLVWFVELLKEEFPERFGKVGWLDRQVGKAVEKEERKRERRRKGFRELR